MLPLYVNRVTGRYRPVLTKYLLLMGGGIVFAWIKVSDKMAGVSRLGESLKLPRFCKGSCSCTYYVVLVAMYLCLFRLYLCHIYRYMYISFDCGYYDSTGVESKLSFNIFPY